MNVLTFWRAFDLNLYAKSGLNTELFRKSGDKTLSTNTAEPLSIHDENLPKNIYLDKRLYKYWTGLEKMGSIISIFF